MRDEGVLTSVGVPMLAPKDVSRIREMSATVDRYSGRPASVWLEWVRDDGRVVILRAVMSDEIPSNRQPSNAPVRGEKGFEWSEPGYAEVGWVSSGVLYVLQGKDFTLDELKAVAQDLTPVTMLSQVQRERLGVLLERGRSRPAPRVVAKAGPFEFVDVPEGAPAPVAFAVHDPKLASKPPVKGTLAGVAEAADFQPVTPKHPGLKLVEAQTVVFAVPYGREKGRTKTAVDLKYLHSDTGKIVWVVQQPIVLGPADRITVVRSGGHRKVTVIDEPDLKGYMVQFGDEGPVLEWYADGILYEMTADLPAETLKEIARSFRR